MNKDKAYKETLAEWRRRNFNQMDIDLAKLISVRDATGECATKCPNCKHKFTVKLNSIDLMKMQLEAIKGIARHLGVLAPEKIEKKEAVVKKESPFTTAQTKALNTRLKGTLGDKWTGFKDAT